MGILETTKDVLKLAQQVDNIDLMRQLVQLQTEVVSLNEENRALKDRLTTRDKLTFRLNSYWIENDGPFCSRCWDAESKLIRLHKNPGFHPKCPSCTSVALDPDGPAPKPIRRVASSYLR